MIIDQIRDIIAEKLGVDISEVTADSSFKELAEDSLYIVEILMAIEDEFSVTIDESEGLETVADIARYVEKKLK